MLKMNLFVIIVITLQMQWPQYQFQKHDSPVKVRKSSTFNLKSEILHSFNLQSEIFKSFEEALREAARLDKKVLVFVDAPWCGWCKKMDEAFFEDSSYMAQLAEHFVPARLGIDDRETMIRFNGYRMSAADWCDRMDVTETPATVFLDSEGRLITVFPSYAEPDFYASLLKYIGSDAYESVSFEDFLAERQTP